ncbi:MAG: lipoyl synthase [Actinomycetota bacterium]
MSSSVLRVRWLGRVAYSEALALQESIFHNGSDNRLLLLEHPHVFTYGPSADLARNLKCDPTQVGAEFVAVNRGGDITYHGPGQLVGYPLLTLPPKLADSEGPADSVAYVHSVEQMIIDSLRELGLQDVGTMSKYPGVWVNPNGDNPRKICAIGVRVSRRRTMHGFALNVSTDLEYMRKHIVPCGISEYAVTSMHEEDIDVSIKDVAEVVSRHAAKMWGNSQLERQDVAWKESLSDLSAFSRGEGPGQPVRMMGRLARAGVEGGVDISARKPDWIRPRVHHGTEVLALKKTLRDASLVTVCEEAGCPNLSECWSSGTATFMVLGERCTRACGFCLIDTQKPLDADHHEPKRVADAVRKMGLSYAVLTMVARDDLVDGGMEHVAQCVRAIRAQDASISVETLISDVRGTDALQILIDERPDVLNHNVETVPRLQRAVRPSAGYARSLSVLARSKRAGLVTKSGLIVGMGETDDEVVGTLADLAAVGVDIVTIGQYLRPTTNHLPVARWVEPHVFEMYKEVGEAFGIGHVESSPLTRSSYHAKESAEHAIGAAVPVSIGVK